MTKLPGESSEPEHMTSRDVIMEMFGSGLGREVTEDTVLTPEEELTAGAEVQGRLDTVSEQMEIMRNGGQMDIDAFMDTEAQAALLERWIETRAQQ